MSASTPPPLAPGEPATVTLPRWLIVMAFGALAAAGGAFLRVDTQLADVRARLAVIEYRLGLDSPRAGVSHAPGVQLAPPAEAAPAGP